MASFKDNQGRAWNLILDAPTIRQVRERCEGFDLAALDGETFNQLAEDPCLLVDVLWVLCEEQAQVAGVTDVLFGKALVGDAIDNASQALIAAVADFFPKARRELLAAVADKNQKLRSLGVTKALAKINDPQLEERVLAAIDEEMDAAIEKALTRFGSATSSPASSGSAPAA